MRRRRGGISNFKAGVIALVIVGSLTYLGFAKHLPFRHEYHVRAVFAQASELHTNSPVRIAGVNVGRVTGTEKGPGNTAVVSMAISDAGRPIHTDATMKVRPRIFLEGNFFVDIRPGSPSAPEVKDNGTIPLAQTATPVQLDQLLDTLDSDSRTQLKILVHQYALALEGGGAEALHDSYPFWEPAFKGVAIVAQATRGTRAGDLPQFINASSRVSQALAAHDVALRGLISNFATTVTALADRRAQLAASVRGLASLLRVSPSALASIDRSVPSLRAFVAEIRPGLRAAPATLRLAVPVLRQLEALVAPGELPALLGGLRPAVSELAALEPGLRALLTRVRAVSDCAGKHAVPVLKATLDDGALSTGTPVWQEFLHAGVGLASASQNFDGSGFEVRYHAGFGDQEVITGKAPGGDRLYGLTPQPLVGSRPVWPGPGHQPPFRPDVPCARDAVPDLKAPLLALTSSPRKAAPAAPSLLRRVERMLRRRAGR